MSQVDAQAKEIFFAALDLQDAEQIQAYVTEACGDNDQLLSRVNELLRSRRVAGEFLEGRRESRTASFDPNSGTRIGERIGPYKLLQEIGEGGMGTVYMAQQEEPVRRRVALKIIKPGMDTKDVIARFEAERQAVSMMDHPNIAHVLEVGTTEARRPYFVMELVKGLPITRYCDEKRLTLRKRLELFKSICNAVQHAHQKGIIHRDIKPSNILVAEYDNQAVPKIIDFGLAKALNQQLTDKTMFTQLGQVVGTLDYMSPEQSKMNQLDVDTRTDVYSLGVLLYELLTGTTPFDKKRLRSGALDQVMKIIREEEPPRPSTRLSTIESQPNIAANRATETKKLSGLVKGDLDWIVMKALDKERSRRYETVNGLAADIQRHLDGEPIVAAPPSARYRMQKFVRRNRVAVTVASLVAAVLLIGILGTTAGMAWAVREKNRADDLAAQSTLAAAAERKANQRAQVSARQAKKEKSNAEYAQYVSNVLAINAFGNTRSPAISRALLKAVPSQYRNWEWAYLANNAWRYYAPNEVVSKKETTGSSADLWRDGAAKVVQEIVPPGTGGGLSYGQFMPDADTVMVMTTNGAIGLFSLTRKNPPEFLAIPDEILWKADTSPDGKRMVASALSGRASVWDLKTRKLISAHGANVELYAANMYRWSPDEKYLASTHFDHSLRIWDAENLEQLAVQINPTNTVLSDIKFSAERDVLWSVSLDGALREWSVPNLEQKPKLVSSAPQNDGLVGQSISPDGTKAAAVLQNGASYLWDTRTGKQLQQLTQPRLNAKMPANTSNNLASFSPDGSCVAVMTDQLETSVFDVADGNLLSKLTGHVAEIRTVRFSNDGARILTVSEDGTAKIWVPVSESTEDAPTYATAHSDIIYQFDISRDGKKLVTGSYDRTARIWDTETRMLLATYDGHESEIVAVDFNNDASHAGSLDATGSLHVWDVATGRRRFAIDPESDAFARHINEAGAGLRNEILSFPGSMSTGIFSPDNSHVVLFHEDSMKAFRASDGSIRVVLEGADACGWPVFSFDSKLVSVLEMNGRTAGVWDLTTGEQVTRLKGHRASMVMMNFSPIDNRIVTGAMDGRTIIWDALTGEAIHNLDVDSSFITTCRFSSDGRFVLTGDAGLCRVWDANTGELLTNLSGHTARTCDIRMSPDQTRFVSWAMDDQIIIWDFARPEAHPLLTFRSRKASKPLESSQLLQAHWTPDGRDIITAWVDGRIEVWSGATRNDLLDFDGRGDNFEADFDNWRARSMNRFADH